MKSEIKNEASYKRTCRYKKKEKKIKIEITNKQKKTKRSNTKLVLVQAKLQYCTVVALIKNLCIFVLI